MLNKLQIAVLKRATIILHATAEAIKNTDAKRETLSLVKDMVDITRQLEIEANP